MIKIEIPKNIRKKMTVILIRFNRFIIFILFNLTLRMKSNIIKMLWRK